MTPEDLLNRFSFHPPTDAKGLLYPIIRDAAHELAKLIDEHCPDSREKSLAITALEEVVMWANASIARN